MPVLLSKVVQMRRSFRARKGSMLGMVLVKNLLLLTIDFAYDLCLCIMFSSSGHDQYFRILAGIKLFSAIIQALSARFVTREGPQPTLAALFGLKIFVEARRTITDEAPGRRSRREGGGSAVLSVCPRARASLSSPDEVCDVRLSPRSRRRAAPGRRFFNPCNFAVTRALMALTESVPKVALFVLIIVETGAASTASIGSYISLVLAFVNVVTTGDLVMAELVPGARASSRRALMRDRRRSSRSKSSSTA